MDRLHCAVVVGTRPEAIKMAPVVRALRHEEENIRSTLLSTGQHRELVEQVLEVFDLSPDVDLELMEPAQRLERFFQRALDSVSRALEDLRPDVVLVQGDTSSVFAASLAAFYLGIPVGHVEAGLRTDQLRDPFPEEANRRLTSVLTDLHFAPTEGSRTNLLRENVDPSRIHVTGNTVIDALHVSREAAETTARREYPFLDGPRRTVLVTAHRRENHGEPLERICRAVDRLVREHEDVQVAWPVHPNPAVAGVVRAHLGGRDRIHLLPPLGYASFLGVTALSTLVLTDSGGVQEEAPALGKPVLTLRETTERPEGVEAGNVLLVGTDEDRIVREAGRLLTDPARYERMAAIASPYGDGLASSRIVEALLFHFDRRRERPRAFEALR